MDPLEERAGIGAHLYTLARIQPGTNRAIGIETKKPIRIQLADLVGASVPVLRLPPKAERASMILIAETTPFRRQGFLEVVLELVAALYASVERFPGVAVHDQLVIVAAQPAEIKERLPPIHDLTE